MTKIRAALLGSGGIAKRYRAAYARLHEVEAVVTVDVVEAEARAAAAETGASRWSTNIQDAFAPDIDAVVVSTPNHLHAAHAIAALEVGKHVLLQKPMARTAEECDRILAAAGRAGKTLGVYMNLLEYPLFRDLRAMVDAGYLGTIGLVSARLAHRGGLAWGGVDTNWRASTERTGGGSYVQLGVHYHHLARWILRDRVVRAQAFATNRACPHLEGDDMALAQLQFASGALADIQTAWCVQEEHFSILGTRGSIHYRDNRRLEYIGEGGPFQGEVLNLKGSGEMEVIDPLLPPAWDDAANPFHQHRSFFTALAEGRAPEVPGEEAREDVRICAAIYESARQGRAITL